jgi:hypothetical protein
MASPDRTVRIARLEGEVQAQLLDAVLTERGVPHLIHSLHDSALDGVYQGTQCWGFVEGPESSRAAVEAALQELAQAGEAPGT